MEGVEGHDVEEFGLVGRDQLHIDLIIMEVGYEFIVMIELMG